MSFDEVTVTVVRPGGTDRYGDELPATEHPLRRCIVYPRAAGSQPSVERHDFSNEVYSGKEILSKDPSPDVRSTDRVRLPGEPATNPDGSPAALWSVEGDPGDWGVGLQLAIYKATG